MRVAVLRSGQPSYVVGLLLLLVTGALVVWAGPLAFAAGGLVLLVGVVAASSAPDIKSAPEVEVSVPDSEPPRGLPTVWTAFLVTFVVFALDFRALLAGTTGLRYALLLVPLAVLLLASRSDQVRRRLRGADVALAALTLWGLAGALVGKLVSQPLSSSLTIVLPMAVGLLHRWNRGRPTEQDCGRMLRHLSTIGFGYVMVYLGATVGAGPLSVIAYSKEKAFLLALAMLAAFVTRRWWLLTLEVAAVAVIFVSEPFATFVVVLVAVVITNVVLSMRSQALKGVALALLTTTVVVGFSLALRPSQDSLVAQYFKLVGKADNTPFRTFLFTRGIEEVEKHPILGTNFTGEVAIRTTFPGVARFAPAHNDFLQLTMAGGLCALGLYLVWIIATNRSAQRSYHVLVARDQRQAANLLRVLVTAYNAFLFSSLVNPLLAGVGTAVMFFLVYAAMSLLFPDDVHVAARDLRKADVGGGGAR
jgi:hypothetical protein